MNRSRINTIAASVIATTMCAASAHAEAHKTIGEMIDTCAQHFVATNFADYPGKVVVETDKGSQETLRYGIDTFYVTVKAAGRTSGAPVGTGTCLMTRKGEVLSMKSYLNPIAKAAIKASKEALARN